MSLPTKIIVLIAGLVALVTLALVGQVASATPYGYGTYGSCQYQVCSISIETQGAVNLPLTPTSSGVQTIASDEVEVTTSSSQGYTLQLESASATETGLVGDDGAIVATSGSVSSPAVLSMNEWGFRVDEGVFGTGPTSAVTDSPSSSLTFAGITTLGSPATVKTTDEPATSGDVTSVWYSVRADTHTVSGTYTGTVVYTATINP